jgi:hypothetical protein
MPGWGQYTDFQTLLVRRGRLAQEIGILSPLTIRRGDDQAC